MRLELKNVSYIYDRDRKDAREAVSNVSLSVEKGEFVGLIGHTGSGKSTLIQFMNGLLRPTSGQVLLDGEDVFEKNYPIRTLRQKVGLVFQYPEYQLFETEILKDVSFGPKNMGLSEEEVLERAKHAIALVGLSEDYYEKSPFEISGGEKRRAAIAGVLAMQPDFLILDEPAAGLDPEGRLGILSQVAKLNKEEGIGVVLVSHSMEDVANFADRLLVMNQGKICFDDTPKNVFRSYRELETMGLSAPQVTYIAHALRSRGIDVPEDLMTVDEASEAILSWYRNYHRESGVSARTGEESSYDT